MEIEQTETSGENFDALATLADYFFNRREGILTNWRLRCEADPNLPGLHSLSREEFNDRIPVLLDVLEARLQRRPEPTDARLRATEHGLHRWHKGYTLRATLAEITHLQPVLDAEISGYLTLNPATPATVIQQAHIAIASLFTDLVRGSIEQYDELERAAAVERVAGLERALAELNDLVRERGEYLRSAAHDLRSNLGIISGAASLLELTDADPDPEREQMVQMVQRNAAIARDMLTDLIDIARLEAGQQTKTLALMDAADLLRGAVAGLQHLGGIARHRSGRRVRP
jgi:signal transduction histidine kinase